MARTASAKPAKLDEFVSAAREIRGELSSRITQLRASYDSFQASGSMPVANPDLMDRELPGFLVNLENDEAFVQVVAAAFRQADPSLSAGGLASVDGRTFDTAFNAVARAAGIDPQILLQTRSPVTVDDPVAAGIPQTSGFVADPVCTATGHFLEAEDDFTWPARLAMLRWTRTYSSRFVAGGPFGRGWASWATVMLVPDGDGSVGYQGPDGQLAVFLPDLANLGSGYRQVSGVAAELERLPGDGSDNGNGTSGGWRLTWDWASAHPGEVWTFEGDGRLVEVTGPATGTTAFRYTGGLLVALEHDSGRRLDLAWDGARVVEVRASGGRVARYRYDEAGDLVHTERVLGDRDYVVDDEGRIVEVRDADGVRLCRNTYDDEGRVLTQVSPFGRETVFSYEPGRRTIVSDTEDGPVSVFEHDEAGRLVALTDDLGHRMQRVFDAEGRCVSAEGFDGAGSQQVFDADDGRSASRVGPDGVEERWEYDDLHRVVAHETVGGPRMTFDYEGDGAVPVRIAGPDGWEIRLEITDGLLRSMTDADGVTVAFGYDGDGNVVSTTNGVGAVTSVGYHVSGEPARVTLPDGSAYAFDRDPAGRLRGVLTPLGEEFGVEWSPAGRLTALVEPNGARTVFEQGSHGAVQRVIDALGAAIDIQHDHLERVVGLSAPGGAKWGFTYSAVGLMSLVTDPSGGVWEYGYDPEGRLVSAADPEGAGIRQRFDQMGRLVEFVDRAGMSSRFEHDEVGRLVGAVDAEGGTTTYEWDAWGRSTAVRTPDGETLRYSYTPAGRVRSVRVGDEAGWDSEYDEAGRLVAMTDTAGATTRLEWDVRDRVTAVTAPSGRATRYRYDGLGRVVETERGGRRWRTAYDHNGRVVAATDPLGATTRYSYDLRGKLEAATDALGQTVRIRYDERGNATGLLDAFGGLVTTEFDDMRRPVGVTDQLGRVTRLVRDRAGRVIRQELPTGDVIEWRRDPRGASRDVRVNGRDVVVFERDGTGRPVLVHEPARNRTFTLGWSAGGRLRRLDVDGREMRWEYGPDGLVASRRDAEGHMTRFGRDRAGRLVSVSDDVWGRIDLDRDADGALVGLRAAGLERRWDYDAGGLVVASHTNGRATSLVRDGAGRVEEIRDDGGATRYRYDAAGQLVAAARGAEAWAWHYDVAGRLAREEGPGGTRTFTYDDAHQLVHVDNPDGPEGSAGRTTYTYDAAGRRVAEDGPAGARRYRWDGLGRLAGIETGTGQHEIDVDALGQLAAVDGTALTWDPTAAVPELLTFGDRRVVNADGLTLGSAGQGAGGTPDWLAGDPVAGPGSAASADGLADPWGRPSAGTDGAAGAVPTLGAGGELELAGLTWLRNRAYDPGTRQFVSPDPLAGIPGLPVAANPYHYANNNPVGFVDRLGLQPISIDQYNEIRRQETGVQWNNIVTVGLVVVGVAACFIPGVGPLAMAGIAAGIGAVGGAAPGVIQGVTTGQWDWGNIAGGALRGAVIGGVSGGLGGGLGALTTRLGTGGGALATTVMSGGGRVAAGGRGLVIGGFEGAVSGTAAELYDVTPLPGSDGSFDPEGIAVNTVVGAGTGGALGAGSYRPTVPTRPDFVASADGVTVPTSQSRMAQGLDDVIASGEPGFSSTPTHNAQGQQNGTQYTLPDGSRVRLMDPQTNTGGAGARASFENANGQPVNPFTGKPVQKPPGWTGTKAEWKQYVREHTHVPQDP
jgi:RHS repeat-associated protein